MFAPERLLFDHTINQGLFRHLGFRHWLYVTNGRHVLDEEPW